MTHPRSLGRPRTMKFRIALFLARLGFFKYDQFAAFTMTHVPQAQIYFPGVPASWQWSSEATEGWSSPMAIGNAYDHARHLGGVVVPLEKFQSTIKRGWS